MQREKLQYLLHYNNIWSKHFQEKKIKKIVKRYYCLSFSPLDMFISSFKFINPNLGGLFRGSF